MISGSEEIDIALRGVLLLLLRVEDLLCLHQVEELLLVDHDHVLDVAGGLGVALCKLRRGA